MYHIQVQAKDFLFPASFENEMLPLIPELRLRHNLSIPLLLLSEILFSLSQCEDFLCCLKSLHFAQGNFLFFLCLAAFCSWYRKKIALKIHSEYFIEIHFKNCYFQRLLLFQIYDWLACLNCLLLAGKYLCLKLNFRPWNLIKICCHSMESKKTKN